MSVNLRDRVFTDTGGAVQSATVQAVLVTGGGSDAGVSSVVQATTTTDVNGVWKFVALPDPGAGNWYDIKITNGNQIRWRYGNIQSALSQLLISNTSFAMPALGIGTAAPGAGIQTAAGNNVGVGVAPFNYIGIALEQALTGSVNQWGIYSNPTGSSGATNEVAGVYAQPATAASAFTAAGVMGFHAANPTKGAGSTITSAFGVYVDAITVGNTNNYGVFINAPSGGSGQNISLLAQGQSLFGTNAAPVTGAVDIVARRSIEASKLAAVGQQVGVKMNVLPTIANGSIGNRLFAVNSVAEDLVGLLIVNTGGGNTGIFTVCGGIGSVTIVSDPNGVFGTVSGSAGKHNIYWNGGNSRVELTNNSGSTTTYYCVGLGL